MIDTMTTEQREYRKRLHAFIEHICEYAECPSSWPLSHDEQAKFVRTIIYQARKIKNTQQHAEEGLLIATEELALLS